MPRQAGALVVTVLIAAAGVIGGGCGRGQDPAIDVPTSEARSTTSTSGAEPGPTTTAVDDVATAAPFVRDTVEVASTGRGLLTDVRTGAHGGFERVVFEFREGRPGVRVAFTERPVTEDASGRTVDVKGAEVVVVRFEPASTADLSQESAPSTYHGPNRIAVDAAPIAEIVKTGDFEAVLSWVLGVDRGARYRVTTLDNPPRVVVDVSAGG